jgi:hypothetical protein
LCSVLLVSSCFLDPDESKDPELPPDPPIQLADLSERWHVLNNIEYAYKNHNTQVYDALLDTEFTFFLFPGDVGGTIPATWGRTDELDVTSQLFESRNWQNPPANKPVCRSIRLDLQFDKDNVSWVAEIPEDFPDQTWYSATIFYEFTFEMEPDLTLIAQTGARAQFTIRNAGTDEEPQWRLVQFRDLGSGS